MTLVHGDIRYLENRMNEDSILTSIKKLLGLNADDKSFDTDVIIHINAALATLNQLGVGKKVSFAVSDESATWTGLFGDNLTLNGLIKTYVYLKVKLVFDPPTSSFVLESIKQSISEYEWRINAAVDY